MNYRGVAVIVAAVAVLATTAGTSAFSATTADRSAEIAVVDDDSAYLSVNVTGNGTNATVTVTNQFPPGTTLTAVKATHDGDARSLLPGDGSLEPGEDSTTTFENATCDDTVTITASGDDVAVELERTIDCS